MPFLVRVRPLSLKLAVYAVILTIAIVAITVTELFRLLVVRQGMVV